MRIVRTIYAICIGLLFLYETSTALASLTFTTSNNSLTDASQEIDLTVNLSLQNQANKTYYLEGAFKNPTSVNYFGLSWNDHAWSKYTASNYSSLKQITTDQNGNWNGSLKVKLDTSSSLFLGTGNYTLFVKRFTSNGSSSWGDNSVNILLTSATPTTAPPTDTPTPAPQTPTLPTSQSSTLFISSVPSSIDSDNSFSITIRINGYQPQALYYLKGAFFKSGSTNYFGKTYVDGNWIKNSQTYSSQLPITTDSSGNWNGSIAITVDTDDSGFVGSGDYLFKVRLYNSSGSSPAWSNEATISITSAQVLAEEVVPTDTQAQTVMTILNPTLPSTSTNKNSKSLPQPTTLKFLPQLPRNLLASSSSVAAIFASPSGIQKVSVQSALSVNIKMWLGGALIFTSLALLAYTAKKI